MILTLFQPININLTFELWSLKIPSLTKKKTEVRSVDKFGLAIQRKAGKVFFRISFVFILKYTIGEMFFQFTNLGS